MESSVDSVFQQFMNTLRLKYDRHKKRGKNQDEWLGGTPISDAHFLKLMEELSPLIIEKWWKYLDAEGSLNLDEAMFGKGNHAQRRAAWKATELRDKMFSHILTVSIDAERLGKKLPNVTQKCRELVSAHPDIDFGDLADLPRKYRYWRSKQTVYTPWGKKTF